MKKTNRTFKRFAAITSASLLAACAVAPVFTSMTSYAAVNGFTMSVPSGIEASEIKNIKAYKIFECELVNGAFNVKSWVIDPTLLGFEEDTSAADAAVTINGADYDIEALAKKAATVLNEDGISGTLSEGKVNFASDLTIGYYLVVCDVERDDKDTNADTTTYDAKSLGMLTVTGRDTDINIGLGTAKIGLPTVEKKVQEDQSDNYNSINNATYETNDKSWNDVADYDIGDAVPFKLYGTMPQNLDKYDAYYYCFNDTLDSQFDKPTNVKITIEDTILYYDADGKQYTDDTFETEVEENNKDNNCTVSYNNGNFIVAFKDIKKYTGVDDETVVTVEYSAILNTTAVVGKPGQDNEVYLTYSNNPNFNYNPNDEDDTNDTPETGDTPKDIVNVLTYAFELEKQFFNAAGGNITANEIKEGTYTGENGAKFTLLSGSGEDTTPLYFVKLNDNSGYDYAVAKSDTPNAITALELTNLNNSTPDDYTDDKLVIRIKGLDEGTYTLRETQAPTGFNKAKDQTIKITASTANGQTWDGEADTLTKFEYKIDTEDTKEAANATASALMKNNQGTSLPGTGGIGTTIFYLGGGAMAAIGGVYLISKRRMKKSEE